MKLLTRFVLLAVLAPAGYSQSTLYTFDGDSAGDNFGVSVNGAGDVNGDGYPDLIVGAAHDANNGPFSGSARVFSGLDGSVLYTFDGDSPYDQFGISVSGAGDVNRDGYADLIVGAYFDDNHGAESGSARVFSGVDGSILYTFDGDSSEDRFGRSVSGAGDLNGDGFDDLIVGAYHDDNNGYYSGSARIFSGVDGSVMYTFDGDSWDDKFGISVSGAGDVNGDGFDDLIVGAYWESGTGSARAFSGLDGSVLHTFHGDSAGSHFGWSVSGAGDVNGDGYSDLIVGARAEDNNGWRSGSARVFSGLDGGVLYTFDGDSVGDCLGNSVSGAGDVNGDGFDDLIVGVMLDDNNAYNSGSARIFSGVDGSVMYTFDGDSADDLFGVSVSGAGDVNGDGFDDLLVGAWRDDNNGRDSGSARVFSGCDCPGTNYCTANPNSSGLPAIIDAIGSDVIADNRLTLRTTQVGPNQFGYYLMSDAQAFVPGFGGSQGNLCLGPPIVRFVKNVKFSGLAGVITLQLDLTSLPQGTVFQPGETWNFQLWFRDVNPNFTSNTSDGLAITFE